MVPLPGKPMAPLPGATVSIVAGQVQVAGAGNPGFPFFIPGKAGHRPPHPPLDTIDDGGLPRHLIVDATFVEAHTRLDWHKELLTAVAQPLPEAGTDDVRINKKGWHFPQQRFSALWHDVAAYLFDDKPPEPLFFRANSRDCITFWLTNLVPHEYDLDDFQVRTPTDILGQHIHLVKFDVTSSDGAANGFNYEDGSFAPEEVIERIDAIRAENGCGPTDPRNGTFACPVAEAHPFFGEGPEGAWIGAQTTVQRWYADPVRNNAGVDRTLRTVFTHDHFGPSTHQQAGLYAGLVVEPTGSTWVHNETGDPLGGRHDGGRKVGGDPQTPIVSTRLVWGDDLRFRLLQPGGHARNIVFTLHGHAWDREPYVEQSTRLGRNPLSFWEGARFGHGPTNHVDAVIRFKPGGAFGIPGDYLFRDAVGTGFDNGLWGILRVLP